MPSPCGRQHGEADPVHREFSIKFSEPELFVAVFCISEAHLNPLGFDCFKNKNVFFLFCFDRAVSGMNQSSINRLNCASHLIYTDKYVTYRGSEVT